MVVASHCWYTSSTFHRLEFTDCRRNKVVVLIRMGGCNQHRGSQVEYGAVRMGMTTVNYLKG